MVFVKMVLALILFVCLKESHGDDTLITWHHLLLNKEYPAHIPTRLPVYVLCINAHSHLSMSLIIVPA